jgi:hypothetical protein
MWCERRIVTAERPNPAARSEARSAARRTSQGPGSFRPSQVSATGVAASTSGSPRAAMSPLASASR